MRSSRIETIIFFHSFNDTSINEMITNIVMNGNSKQNQFHTLNSIPAKSYGTY